MDIAANLFNNLSPGGWEFLVSEGVQYPIIPPADINKQGNQRLLLVINAAVESYKNGITTKESLQTAGENPKTRLFVGMLGRSSSTEIIGLGGISKMRTITPRQQKLWRNMK